MGVDASMRSISSSSVSPVYGKMLQNSTKIGTSDMKRKKAALAEYAFMSSCRILTTNLLALKNNSIISDKSLQT